MVLRVLDIVKACDTADQGFIVAEAIREKLKDVKVVTLSFAGVSNTPSSFINASIVSLVLQDPPDNLQERLIISNITDQIAGMITRCLRNGRRAAAENA